MPFGERPADPLAREACALREVVLTLTTYHQLAGFAQHFGSQLKGQATHFRRPKELLPVQEAGILRGYKKKAHRIP